MRKKAAATEVPKVRKKPGPKPGQIAPATLHAIAKLAEMQCTSEEMAIFFEKNLRTIERWRELPIVMDAIERGRTKGRIALRRVQYQTAMRGDRTMLIWFWLGKQWLGQKDRTEVEHVGTFSVVVERLQAARARLAAGPPAATA